MKTSKTALSSALVAALCLAAAGAAHAVTSTDIQYLQTNGITVTTSGTEDGYLTGAMQFVNSQGASFQAFCVELAQGYAPTSAGYQSYSIGSFSGTQASMLQGLYSTSYATLSTPQDYAAFQTAVWKITQDPGSTPNVDSGSFQFWYLSAVSTDEQDSAFRAEANSMLQAAASYTGAPEYTLTRLSNASYQDYVTASAVPEPESYALMLGGLGVIGFVARRRQPR